MSTLIKKPKLPNKVKVFPTLKIEKQFWSTGSSVIGIDEVGRGCLAGPVVAGAVSFNQDHKLIQGITDSKKLSAAQRDTFSFQIKKFSKDFAIGVASVQEINTLGIVPATFLAMERALLQLNKVEAVLVDGSLLPHFKQVKPQSMKTIIKGDQLSYSIAAASIIAKVHRDELMKKLHQTFLEFGWDQNKGYGTLKHREAILKNGITEHHRLLFCRNLLQT